MVFSKDELERYDRHLKLDQFDLLKQKSLKESKVLIVGAGGLGCPIGLYLGAAGIGNIIIVDDDKIELSNLQRQVAFSTNDIGADKAEVLAKRIASLNPAIVVAHILERLDSNNIEKIITGFDLVIDGTDNFASRFLIADTCYFKKIAYLHAAVYQFQGQVSLFVSEQTACFRCLFRKPPAITALPACNEAGILGAVTGIIGSIAAAEAIKFISGLGETIAGKMIIYDVLSERFKTLPIERDQNCMLCSNNASKSDWQKFVAEQKYFDQCEARTALVSHIISIDETIRLLDEKSGQQAMLLDVREEHEYKRGHLAGASLWTLSEMQSLSVESIRSQLKSKLKEGIKNGAHGLKPKVLCYCQRGARSLKAIAILREAGIENVYSVDGGLEALERL